MQFSIEKKQTGFFDRCAPLLTQNADEHARILSLREQQTDGAHVYCYATTEDGCVFCGVRMQDGRLILSHDQSGDTEKTLLLAAEQLAAAGVSFDSITAPAHICSMFSDIWQSRSGRDFDAYIEQNIYTLSAVDMPFVPAGTMTAATRDDLDICTGWMMDFAAVAFPVSIGMTEDRARRGVERHINAGHLWLWRNTAGVAAAMLCAETRGDTVWLSRVFTPMEHRGSGYASALVAMRSRMALADGARQCGLYADARNPVSNRIYRRVGYRFVSRIGICGQMDVQAD